MIHRRTPAPKRLGERTRPVARQPRVIQRRGREEDSVFTNRIGPPIAILTRNRHVYLDVMLRGLARAGLHPKQQVAIFDDSSDDADTLTYLTTDQPVALAGAWPNTLAWRRAGLAAVVSRQQGVGPAGRIQVVNLPSEARGVVNASCAIIRRAMAINAPGLVMLQDDVLLQHDWLDRMVRAADIDRSLNKPAGLVSGIHTGSTRSASNLSHVCWALTKPAACCIYITPAGLAAIADWVNVQHERVKGFDDKVSERIMAAGLGAYVMRPGIGQHFGVKSLVRPTRGWLFRADGRTDKSVFGPFSLAAEIPTFRPWPEKEV